MEVVREQRKLVMRIPTDGGGRLVVELNDEEAANLKAALSGVLSAA
jgi:tRNA threonylcarbamoyladenosine modification (KEOPS) complex  Pcc1 subunit